MTDTIKLLGHCKVFLLITARVDISLFYESQECVSFYFAGISLTAKNGNFLNKYQSLSVRIKKVEEFFQQSTAKK